MRWLEVRRHSLTKKGTARGHGSHLSQAGVDLAARVGREIGPVHYVAASMVPRTLETALAMGYAVDELIDWDGGIPARDEVPHHAQWEWEHPYARYAELIETGGAIAALADRQVTLWRRLVEQVPEGGSALAISHGGLIEPGLAGCFPHVDHIDHADRTDPADGTDGTDGTGRTDPAAWGGPFAHLDGARLGYADGEWCSIEFRRVASAEI